MGRQPCCDKVGLKKGPWSAEEDQKLITFIITHGHCCWRAVPKLAGLLRCGKSCRLRWTNYLRPDLKRGILSESEEQMIIDLHAKIGNRWSKIASQLPGRTDNEIKNYWNTHIKKKLKKMGIDPVSHKPLTDSSTSDNNDATTTDITLEDDKPATNRSKAKGSEEGKKRKKAKDEETKSTTTKDNSCIEASISSRSNEESGITDESSKSYRETVKTEGINCVINVNETMVTELASCNNAHACLESMLFDETTSVYLPDTAVSSSSVVDSGVSVSDEGLMDYVKHDEDPFADSFFSGSNLGFSEFAQDQPPHRIENEIDFMMPFGGLDLAIEEEDALNAVINGVPENLSWSTSTQQQVQIPDLDVPLWHDSFHSMNGYGWEADIASLEQQQFPPPHHNHVSHFPSHMFY